MTDRWRHREPETLRMNFQNRPLGWALLPERIRGMFNLNDPRWGRGEDKSDDDPGPPHDRPRTPPGPPTIAPAHRRPASAAMTSALAAPAVPVIRSRRTSTKSCAT